MSINQESVAAVEPQHNLQKERVRGSNGDGTNTSLEANCTQDAPPSRAVDQVHQSDGVIDRHTDQSGTQLGHHPQQPQTNHQRRRVLSFPLSSNSKSSDCVESFQRPVVIRDDSLNTTQPERKSRRDRALIIPAAGLVQPRCNSLSPRGRVESCLTFDNGPPGLQRPADSQSLDSPTYTSPTRLRSQSPEDFRTLPFTSKGRPLNCVPEESEMDASTIHQQSTSQSTRRGESQRLNQPAGIAYGATSRQHSGHALPNFAITTEPVDYDSDDDSSNTDEEEWILDEELAREGLYRGNYKRLITLYTLVPLSTILTFVFLALLPIVALPEASPSSPPFPYPRYVPYPLPEILTAAALWSLSYLLRDFFYTVPLTCVSFLPTLSHRYPNLNLILVSVISAILQSTSTLVLRQLAIPILLIPYYTTQRFGMVQKSHFPTWHDDAFRRVWWIALGWAAAEAIVGIKQGYESIALYKDVLVSVKKSAGRTETAGAVAGLRGTPSRPMDVREPASNKHLIEGLPHTTSQSRSPKTPVQALFDPDNDIESASYATPTQRNWGRTRALSDGIITGDGDVTPQLPPPPPMQREHSDSLASSVNSVAGYGYGSVYGMEGLTNGAKNLSAAFDPLPRIDSFAGEREPLLLTLSRQRKTESLLGDANSEHGRLLAEDEVERDLQELLALKNREELEEVYGIPVIRIPVFISCLFRINSILSSLAMTLILTAAYMRSTFATYRPTTPPTSSAISFIQYIIPSHPNISSITQTQPENTDDSFLIYAFVSLLTLQSVFGMMHTPWILPCIGVHTFVYVQLVILLALFFGGLGIWEVLT
ncbi:hypothetical protein CVT24_007259 [Panaeolus cyanescens]|uniref:Uncharacterized protein n=1 Tax=Panaeolus cyanescens TaxID=181874 RepID=A0A409W5N6_9AGAR|nr:hypothetical protein CVT24_007259 [Panaeolus cyanescens]